ncbi:MAG: prolyl oligopeptidase family serine peptidase [Sedimentisphaerales bacterium]|nr:prolyl oligopeptidase family serine peptidase [Sedimentisphaerales bacterium]
MLKKYFLIVFVLSLATAAIPSVVFAQAYTGRQGNEATFETLEEARINGPNAVAKISGNRGTYKSHPALDNYPKGTTYIYRSPNLYGGHAAARLNTDILVFAEKTFAGKDEAKQYLNNLGLIEIVNGVTGSIILATPANGRAFGASDQKNYYAIQTAIFAQKARESSGQAGAGGMPMGGARGGDRGGAMPGMGGARSGAGGGMPPMGGAPGGAAGGMPAMGGTRGGARGGMGGMMGGGGASYCDAEYFGGFGYTYVIGIDGGATFLNNYIAGTIDYVSRIAGMLLINGNIDTGREIAAHVPVYLVNASEKAVELYKKANNTNAYEKIGDIEAYFDQSLPLKRVVVARNDNPDVAKYINDAYHNLFIKAMRVPVARPGVHSASTPYQGYSMDQAPLSLCERNAVINGKTMDGIVVIDRIGESLMDTVQNVTWFEYVPEEVLNNTVPEKTVPLILSNHGGGDDPRQFTEEIGILPLAGKERFAIVASDSQSTGQLPQNLPLLVKYMLKKYPALDPSRVYVLGYSMGGAATLQAINGEPSLFAAAVPMAAAGYTGTPEQQEKLKKARLPVMFTTSSFDLGGAFDQVNGNIATGYQSQINMFLGYNGMKTIQYDFKTYPISGFKADRMIRILSNGEYNTHRWYINDDKGVPMVAVSYTENLQHALYPEYGKIAWEFFKHYSRDQKTGEIKYNPYAD